MDKNPKTPKPQNPKTPCAKIFHSVKDIRSVFNLKGGSQVRQVLSVSLGHGRSVNVVDEIVGGGQFESCDSLLCLCVKHLRAAEAHSTANVLEGALVCI